MKPDCIIAAGRGAGKEGARLIRELAELTGAGLGATRAAVEAGWLEREYEIGLSGRKVRPDVYIACGISGTNFHMLGVMGSPLVIAVNRDRTAPVFRYAQVGIVAPCEIILPPLVSRLWDKKSGGFDDVGLSEEMISYFLLHDSRQCRIL